MKWISTTKLPPLGKRVLVYSPKCKIVISRLEKDNELNEPIYWYDDDGYTTKVESSTHWMEIPKEPK